MSLNNTNSTQHKFILITGSNGQLGKEIQRNIKVLPEYFHFLYTDVDNLDITDATAVNEFVELNHVDYIVNCAAYTAVDRAEDDKELCYKINRDAVANLAIAADRYGAKIIHVSTDYVFDGTATQPYQPDDTVSPQSVYGRSKAEGEQLLLQHCQEAAIVRTAWLYSIFGNNFVKTMLRLAGERDSINVVADQKGSPTNAGDLARAILSMINFAENHSFVSGIYHFTDEGETTWYDFTQKIFEYAAIKNCKVNPISTAEYPTKAKRPAYSVLDKQKIKETFGIDIPTWQESLKICVDELLK